MNLSKNFSPEFFNKIYFTNRIIDYFFCFTLIIASIVIVELLRIFIVGKLKILLKKTDSDFDDTLIENLEKTLFPVLYFCAFYYSIQSLHLTFLFHKLLNAVLAVVVTFFGIKFIIQFVTDSIKTYWIKKEGDNKRAQSIKGLLLVIKVIIWTAGIVFLLDNLGFKISAVIAGLGIGGMAVALAAQTILKDLFSYIAILFDKPFEVGDFIVVGDKKGTVEKIGIKTTRLTSINGEQLIFSNTEITDKPIQNFKRMKHRRIQFTTFVSYETEVEVLKQIPQRIKSIISELDSVKFERCNFASYGDFGLCFETVYFVLDGDHNLYMNIQEKINLQIFTEFKKYKIEFASQHQMLPVNKS